VGLADGASVSPGDGASVSPGEGASKRLSPGDGASVSSQSAVLLSAPPDAATLPSADVMSHVISFGHEPVETSQTPSEPADRAPSEAHH